ncbi:hypothetical protein, partial [Sulfoacidibacillus ferrooxidans]|uniref:hypothetical protein n=1 Tax=Sulfoacidibacillus ferrooxidans TaxID=2005001 RepID=UPI001F512EBE
IEELRHVTGWEIVVSDKVQQQALIRLAEQITPGVIKTPSVYLAKKAVGVRTEQHLSSEVIEAFARQTKWHLQAE